MKRFQAVSKTYALAMVAIACLLGLGSSALCSPELTQSSGYHTDPMKPSVSSISVYDTGDQNRQAELLNDSLARIKSGDLSSAARTLEQLVKVAPEEPGYSQLLAIVRRQLQAESWYRYQRHFGLGWAAN